MTKSRISGIFLFLVTLIAMIGCGRYYFKLFKEEIDTFAMRDSVILHEYNEEIIAKFEKTASTDEWQEIIDSYEEEIIVQIADRDGNLVAVTKDKEWSILDVKIQNPFTYNDEAYMIRSSVYFLRGYLTDTIYLSRFIFVILLIVLLFGLLIVALIYAFMLRPVYKLYKNIERYENGIKPKRTESRTQIGLLQNRFVEMTETIDKQQENQRRIIASISHDIKTPLTSIMGYAELLKKENLSEERKQRYLNTIYQRSTDIKGLIDDFDEYLSYKMESSMKTSEIAVSEMLENLTDGYEEELSQHSVRFIYHKPDIDGSVNVDIIKLRRVIGNIIANSLKHFKSERKIIDFSCREEDDELVMVISDSGEGVPQDKLKVIFEPLYTSDEGRKVAGLGLAICKEIIESHDGTIHAESSKEYGGLSIVIKLRLIK